VASKRRWDVDLEKHLETTADMSLGGEETWSLGGGVQSLDSLRKDQGVVSVELFMNLRNR
jgi:hypothetical protein